MNQEHKFVFQSIAGLPGNQQLHKIKFCQENPNVLKSGSGRTSKREDKKKESKAPPPSEEPWKDWDNRQGRRA